MSRGGAPIEVGVLGAGQLGQMLGQAGVSLGMRMRFLDPANDPPAAGVGRLFKGAFDDPARLDELASGASVVTYEFENVPAPSVERLCAKIDVHPSPRALAVAQDRLEEKRAFERLGVATTRFAPVASEMDLRDALRSVGLPAVLKTRRMGYDGKGQAVLRSEADVPGAWAAMGGVASLIENFVPFEREVSIIAVRGRDGAHAFYPLVENVHRAGILRVSRAPAADPGEELRGQAERAATALLDDLGYVGVLTIEFFVVRDSSGRGSLVANEMAPRVHNSGHWTIEGAACSQFENHLRAVCGLPLGSTRAVGRSVMLNIIGDAPPLEALLRAPGAHAHLYGKSPAPGRKLGHVTIVGADDAEVSANLGELRASLARSGWRNSDGAAIGDPSAT